MGNPIRRVAVIGAGPAGAIATDALVKEQVFDTVRVFDRKTVPGGTWVYAPEQQPGIPSMQALIAGHADPPADIPAAFPAQTAYAETLNSHQWRYADTGVHDHLHSNLAPEHMAFTQEPIPTVVSERAAAQYGPDAPFRHREVVRQWVEDLFRKGGHSDRLSLGTTVERAEKNGAEWVLTLRKEAADETKTNEWWQETFDAVVVAIGRFSVPYVPDIPGLAAYVERFPGRITHSKHYRSVDAFAGKTVVVVGGSISAFDALHEVRRVARRPVIAALREPIPTFGWGAFVHPHVQIRPRIVRFHADGTHAGRIDFADGSFVDDDNVAVLLATGYDFSFPFLPDMQATRFRNRRMRGLYQHVFDIEDPSLAFVGMITGGLTFRVFEWQAVAVARLFAGRASLPTTDVMRQWEAFRVSDRGDGVGFFSIAPGFRQYFEYLRQLAGDPAPGTTGRVLPEFQQEWAESFAGVIWLRQQWWEKERRLAETERTDE